jgi:UDP-glucose 4-epimerase
MHYLVTGGAGFIGSHLVEALVARGDQVTVLDDFSTGREANLAAVAGRIRVVRGSVADDAAVVDALTGVDQVVHLAAAVGVRKIMEDRVGGIRTNVQGSETVFVACARRGLPLFLASTSETYGKNTAVPFREDADSVLGPTGLHRWSYACAKLLDEFLALAYFHEHRLPVVVARFFNVTGPRQCPDYGMVLPRFCQAALAGGALEVHGSGQQSRCFLHVEDCVAAILLLLDCPAAIGEVVNIGSDEETTIQALAERVISRVGRGALRRIPYATAFPEGGFEDMQRRVPDTGKLTRLTGWRRRHNLETTIADAVRWAGS